MSLSFLSSSLGRCLTPSPSREEVRTGIVALKELKYRLYISELDEVKRLLQERDLSVLEKIEHLSPSVKRYLQFCVWAACGRPMGNPRFGEERLRQEPALLLRVQDRCGLSLLDQVRAHYERKAHCAQLEHLQGHPDRLGEGFRQLNGQKEFLAERVWETAGRPEEWRYGEKKIERDPLCLTLPLQELIDAYRKQIQHKRDAIRQHLDTSFPQTPQPLLTLAPAFPRARKIILVSAEFKGMGYTLAKVGGLAEAVGGLAEALTLKGYDVRLIFPDYDTLAEIPCAQKPGQTFRKARLKGMVCYFLQDETRYRVKGVPNGIYGPDQAALCERFSVFCTQATSLIRYLHARDPSLIVHLHDWHAALTARYLKESGIPIVFTFHNNNRCAQGIFPPGSIAEHEVNALVEAVSLAAFTTTVSRQFATEVQEPPLGEGIDHVMREAAARARLTGITNGSNPSAFDPEADPQLAHWLDPETQEPSPLTYRKDLETLTAWKERVAAQLQKWLRIHHPEVSIDLMRPIVTFIGRFDDPEGGQKGLCHLPALIDAAKREGAQFIVMGASESGGAPRFLDELQEKALEEGGAWIIRGMEMQQLISSLVRAVSTILTVPSRTEPCGLVQFEAWLFGCLALGTRTGGLADTIFTDGPLFNGFLVERQGEWSSEQQHAAFGAALQGALRYWKELDEGAQNALLERVMQQARSSSWTAAVQGLSPVEQYLSAYARAERRPLVLSNYLS
jgi:starch synthase